MSTRMAKQMIYGAFFVAILLFIFGSGYFIFVRPFVHSAPAVVCTPETCAPTSTAPVSANLISTFLTGQDRDTFLGQITNTSLDYGASVVTYEVDLYDASDTVLQSVPGQTFIYPNQNKYVLLPNAAIDQPFDHAALNITGVSWVPGSALGMNPTPGADSAIATSTFGVQSVVGSMVGNTISVGGVITNAGITSYSRVIVMVLLDDIYGEVAGASQTELDNMPPGATENFSVIYPAQGGLNLNRSQVIVYAIH